MEQDLNIPHTAIQYVLDEDGNTREETMRQTVIPTTEQVVLSIPKEWIDKEIEIVLRPLQAKRDRLRAISDTYHVQLPKHCEFDRAELHER